MRLGGYKIGGVVAALFLALVLALFLALLPYRVTIETSGTVSITSIVYAAPDTETLRPSSGGDYAQWDLGDSTDYGATSDQLDTTDISTNITGEIDLMGIQDHSVGSGTINSVTIWFRGQVFNGAGTPERAATYIKTNGSYFQGADNTMIDEPAWGDYSEVYLTNPQTLSAWTWTEVDALQAGAVTTTQDLDEPIHVSEVWVVVDYTPCSPNITNTPSSYAFGTFEENSTSNTSLTYFAVTNSSGGAINIGIQGTDMVGGVNWTLSDNATPGPNIYGLKAGTSTDGDYVTIVKKNSPYNNLITGMADSANETWGIKLYAPTSFSDGVVKTSTVTLTATCL